ncbi:MAG TPA: winged helix DNA-binding domain-containing protein [Thermomicrobiales bacterium]|nr:winged helix DNA-binding domain-containing protein [Thermomicrobiales bacterium]
MTADPSPSRRNARAAERLSERALNRALLERQMLLRRSDISAEDAIERLVGLQAQTPASSYLGLWSRLADFDPDAASRLLAERRVVRIALMRSTIHLVTAGDCLALRPLIQPVLDRELAGSRTIGPMLGEIDVDALVAAGRALLDDAPRTPMDLGTLLQARWPGRDPSALAHVVRNRAPLVQMPPRGLWGERGRTTLATVESWLGRPLAAAPSLPAMIERYLTAFGPATVGDIQAWSGLSGLRSTVDAMRPALRHFQDERGRELLDLPDAPRPDANLPALPRFLPDYDNALLGPADRRRVFADDQRRRVSIGRPTFLVDGFVAGTWSLSRRRDAARLRLEPFAPLSHRDRIAVAEEGERLLAFLAADASDRDIEIA